MTDDASGYRMIDSVQEARYWLDTAVHWANLRDKHGRVHRAVGPWLVLCVGRLRVCRSTSAPVDCPFCK